MSDMFVSPSESASGVKIPDLDGHLLLVHPTEYIEKMATNFGEKDAVKADVVDLDADGGPEKHTDILIFQGRVIGQTKRQIGGWVLGRVTQLPATQKGFNPSWSLEDGTDADKAKATDYLKSVATSLI